MKTEAVGGQGVRPWYLKSQGCNAQMRTRNVRGQALTMVLMIAAILATMAFAASALLPLGAEMLDDHEELALAQSFADSAIEEALANLHAGSSPEFSHDIDDQNVKGSVRVRQLGKPETPDSVELIAVSQMTSPRMGRNDKPMEWRIRIRTLAMRDAAGNWRVKEYTLLKPD